MADKSYALVLYMSDGRVVPAGHVLIPAGDPGFSPIAELEQIEGGIRVKITDAGGTKSYDLYHGTDGLDGNDGSDGVGIDSISQTTVSDENGGTNIFTVTLTNGESAEFSVKNGQKGADGVMTFEELTDEQKETLRGAPGAPGAKGDDGVSVVGAEITEVV